MIRLCLPKEPYWLDLPFGVRLHVRPLTTATYEAARIKGWRKARAVAREYADLRSVGGDVSGLPDLRDDDAVAGFSQLLFAQGLARAAILDWEGVLDAEGNPAASFPPPGSPGRPPSTSRCRGCPRRPPPPTAPKPPDWPGICSTSLDELQRALKEEADARARGKELVRQHRTAEQEYADTLRELNDLLAQGALDADTHARAIEAAERRKLAASKEWSDGAKRALAAYVEESSDAARGAERVVTGMLKSSEDAFVKWATTAKLAAGDLFNTLAEEALRAAWRMAVVAPLFGGAGGGGLFGGLIAGIGSFFSGTGSAGASGGGGSVPSTGNFAIAHTGGLVGLDRLETRRYSASVFASAPKFHAGGLVAGERPIVARVGEGVFTPRQMDNADRLLGTALSRPAVGVVVTVNNNASGTQASAEQSQGADGRVHLDIIVEEIEGRMSRRIGRGEGMAPVLEHRYGLNPAAGSYR